MTDPFDRHRIDLRISYSLSNIQRIHIEHQKVIRMPFETERTLIIKPDNPQQQDITSESKINLNENDFEEQFKVKLEPKCRGNDRWIVHTRIESNFTVAELKNPETLRYFRQHDIYMTPERFNRCKVRTIGHLLNVHPGFTFGTKSEWKPQNA